MPSSPATAARGSWPGASRSRATNVPPIALMSIGASRYRGLAIRRRGCWSAAWAAAHGGNRTGRVFTGDRSGDWLFAALYRAGFANQPTSTHRDDGLTLRDCYITACVRCAPPDNKPTIAERDNCLGYLGAELDLLPRVRAIICLGGFAWDNVWRTLRQKMAGLQAAQAALRARRDGGVRPLRDCRLLSSEPTKHVHRPTDRSDA